jgi:hypothetical protein
MIGRGKVLSILRFRDLSGLSLNPSKRSLFICGVKVSVNKSLLDILGYNESILIIRIYIIYIYIWSNYLLKVKEVRNC